MSDPITIGSLAASALAMAAPEVVKAAVSEGVKDAYKALKDKVGHWASVEVASLEAAPSSKGRQLTVAEVIEDQSEEDKQALKVLAEDLAAKLKDNAPAIGLDVTRVTDLEMEFGKVIVTSGVGVRVRDALGGKLKTGDISVGGGSEN